jgi:hypothetical protein
MAGAFAVIVDCLDERTHCPELVPLGSLSS